MIRIEEKERVPGVVLSRPEALNALTPAMLRELIAIGEGAGRSPGIRVIVVRGDGDRAFSAGYDIGSIPESGGDFEPEALLDGAADGLQQCPKPVTAMIRFACLTWDSYPLHTDEEFARTTVYGTRIASGPMTFSFAVGLMAVSQVFQDRIIGFLGLGDRRTLAPVRGGDTIRVEAEVTDNRPTSTPGRAVVAMRYAIVNQTKERVLTAEMRFLVHAPAAGA